MILAKYLLQLKYIAIKLIKGTTNTFIKLYIQESLDDIASTNEISASFAPIANQASGEERAAKYVIGLNNQKAVLSILKNA